MYPKQELILLVARKAEMRRRIIEGSEEYGLPTATEEGVACCYARRH